MIAGPGTLSGVAQNRLVLLAVTVIAAAVIAGVLIAVASSKHDGGSTTTNAAPAASATSSFAGVPQHGDVLGDPSAPATLLVFEDPQCPFCQEWALGTLPQVVADYVKTGRVKLAYRGIEVIGPNSQPGLRAIYAAGLQNKLWNLAEALYRQQGAENSGWITNPTISAAAGLVGANGKAILAHSNSPMVTAGLHQAAAEAGAAGINGTPTFVLENPPARPQALQLSALDTATFEAALEHALA
jgi:protein-disulfide isomerase